MTPEDWAARKEALAQNGTWEKPAGMPIINVEDGSILDMSAGNFSKREGTRTIYAYKHRDCKHKPLRAISAFGCGTGCISMKIRAHSGRVQEGHNDNPHPVMDIWESKDCSGTILDHFGVVNMDSCTNVQDKGFKSFVGYYDCHLA